MTFITFCLLATFGYTLAQQGNIVQEAEKLGATELVKLATLAGLGDTLSNKGPFTVFAPTNEAFQRLPKVVVEELLKNKTLLAELLEYHVLNGVVKSTDLSNDKLAPTLLANTSVRANIYKVEDKTVVTIDGSPVIKADQLASNGIIHVVEKVLFPVPLGTVVDLVSKEPPLSTLLTAVKAANLAGALSAPGPFTVFAPTDEAFKKLPPGALDNLLKNITALTSVLEYHVVKGTYYSAGIGRQVQLTTLQGKSVEVKHEGPGRLQVNHARVEVPDVSVTNGVAHVIDQVLLPPQEMHRLFGLY